MLSFLVFNMALLLLQLLEEDVPLKRFKSYKNGVKQVSKIGSVLTLAVVLGIYVFLVGFS
jgi:hypothetical protein